MDCTTLYRQHQALSGLRKNAMSNHPVDIAFLVPGSTDRSLRQKCQHGFCIMTLRYTAHLYKVSARVRWKSDDGSQLQENMLQGLECHIPSEFFGGAVTTHDSLWRYYTTFHPCPCHGNKHQDWMRYCLLVFWLASDGFCRILSDCSSTVNVN